jgi:ribose transport system permease protein
LAANLFHIPGAVFTVGAVLLFWFFFRRTAYYGALFAVGGDDVAAFSAGVDATVVRIGAYALGGMIAAIGGIALTGTIQSADITVWPSFVLIALAAVALGGTSLSGGRGGFLGSALGALCVYEIQTLIPAIGIDVFYLEVAYGCILLVAVVLGSRLGKPARGAGGAR